MVTDTRFNQALQSSDRVGELRRLAQGLLEKGSAPAEVLGRFEAVRQELRTAGREQEEDAVMDVMDFLTGWCSPYMILSATPPPNGSIRGN